MESPWEMGCHVINFSKVIILESFSIIILKNQIITNRDLQIILLFMDF